MPNAPKPIKPKATRGPWERPAGYVDLREGFRGEKRRQAKLRVLQRDGCECMECGRLVDEKSSHLDHIVPLSQGGGHDDNNLQTLCIGCSKRKTARESNQARG